MDYSEKYRELSEIMKDKSTWLEKISYVGNYVVSDNVKLKAKAVWIIGEMGLQYPKEVFPFVSSIARLLSDNDSLLRCRALNALGRIGRGLFANIEPYWESMFDLANDIDPEVRLSFIWASENIATTYPSLYEHHMEVFSKFLSDESDRVRMESPEIFRVLGKRKPEYVLPYLNILKKMAVNDQNEVVRIHSNGAIKATNKALEGQNGLQE